MWLNSRCLITVKYHFFYPFPPTSDTFHKFTTLSLSSKPFASAPDKWPCYLPNKDHRHLFWVLSTLLSFSLISLYCYLFCRTFGEQESYEKVNESFQRKKKEWEVKGRTTHFHLGLSGSLKYDFPNTYFSHSLPCNLIFSSPKKIRM